MTYFVIAWRNLIKNGRRTAILMMAIAVGLFCNLFFAAVIDGFYVKMVDNAVDATLGHLQINQKDFRLRQDAKYVIPEPEKIIALVKKLPHLVGYTPRVVCQGIVASPDTSQFVQIYGIDQKMEESVCVTVRNISQGKPVMPDDRDGILLGQALADKLKVGLDDKVVVMVRNVKGEMEGAALRVRGIFKGQTRDLEKAQLYISIKRAQQLLGIDGKIHQVAIRLEKTNYIADTVTTLSREINDGEVAVEAWWHIVPLLKQEIDMSWVSALIMYIIVFSALAFGIVNSFLMEIFERIKEFGIMMALGTRPQNIFIMLIYESILLGIGGCIVGVIMSFIIMKIFMGGQLDMTNFAEGLEYYGFSAIIPLLVSPKAFLEITGGIILTVVLATLYPAIRAATFRPVEAMHHV